MHKRSHTTKSHHRKLRGKGWGDFLKKAVEVGRKVAPHALAASKALGGSDYLKRQGGFAGLAGEALGAAGGRKPRHRRMRRC
jgi:hypothetical protein